MKTYFTILVILAVTVLSCTKEAGTSPSAVQLIGKWVNSEHRLDTLEVYNENGKIILFDNSFYFRTNLAIWTNDHFFKKEIQKIDGEQIFVRPYLSQEEYFNYYFKWLDRPNKFELRVQALHPEVSALYNITYVKVK